MQKLSIGETVREALTADLALEQRNRATLVEGVTLAETHKDYVSRDLMQHILKDTEDHLDYLETQVDLIELIGEPNYLQSAVGGLDENKSQAPGGD